MLLCTDLALVVLLVFFFLVVPSIILALFLSCFPFPVPPDVTQIQGHYSKQALLPRPHYIARRLQLFLPSSTRIELRLVAPSFRCVMFGSFYSFGMVWGPDTSYEEHSHSSPLGLYDLQLLLVLYSYSIAVTRAHSYYVRVFSCESTTARRCPHIPTHVVAKLLLGYAASSIPASRHWTRVLRADACIV